MTTPHALTQRFIDRWTSPCFQTLDDQVLTYGDIWQTAATIAESWRDDGLKPGDVIAFRLTNSYRIPCAYLACAMAGVVACPIVPTLKPDTVRSNLDTVAPARLIEGEPDWTIRSGGSDSSQTAALNIDGQRPFLIMFSSGSTGRNKAICHHLDAVSGSAEAFATLSGFDHSTRLYHVLPMTYMAGFLNSLLAVWMAGGKVVEGPQFSLETVAGFWQRPLATDANALSVIPPLAAAVCRLTRNPETCRQVAAQFQQVQCTSQAIQVDLRRRFLEKFSLPLKDCYGMTELGGPLSLQDGEDAAKAGNRTRPLPTLDLDIRDNGALWIRSPYLMMGYLTDGQLSNPADAEGYLDTGDLAEFANDQLEITGRIKDIIIRGGINTSPVKIESVMSEFPGIEEVSVVGLPHNFWGEEIVACLVGDVKEAEVLALCQTHLDQHEVPDRLVFLDALPRSFIGKVLKQALITEVSSHG